MDIFASFATDESLENEGKWFNLSKTAKVRVARSGNAKYVKQLRKKLEENRIDLDSQGDEANELAEKVMIDVLADTILVGWEGLEYRGKPMEYSRLNARILLQVKDFRRKIVGFSESFEAFKVKQEEELGNDSAPTLNGDSSGANT
jgi:hypothetical protein